MDSDLILLRRFKESRDPDAFGEIVRRYAGAVFATCHRILHDPGRAEDAAQETFYRLMTRPQKVSESLGGWLHRAATRLALDIRRSELSRYYRETTYLPEPAAEASHWADVAPKLDEALAALPAEQRDLLVRHFLRGEPQSELAAEIQTSPATLSRRIRAAVDALRAELARRGLSIAPSLVLTTLLQCGNLSAPAGLKLAMGKMILFCTTQSAGIMATKLTLASAVRSIPRLVYSFRWGIAAAGFSLAVALLAAQSLRHLYLPQEGQTEPVLRDQSADLRMNHHTF